MARTVTSNSGAIKLTNPGDNPLTINAGVTVSGGNYAVEATFDQAWSIVNLGTLLGGKYAVYLNDGNTGGSVLNNSGTAALISGTTLGVEVLGPDSTVINTGRILGGTGDGVDVDTRSGTVTNSGSGAVIQGGVHGIYASTYATVITNSGTIRGVTGDGVFLKAGGTVTNSSTSARIVGDGAGITASGGAIVISNAGTIDGNFGDGVDLAAGGTVTNSGTAATIHGSTYGILATAMAAAVVNTGTISGANGDGVYLKAGGQVTNNSTAAVVSGAVYGIRIIGATGTVANQGIIFSPNAAVDMLAGGTLANTASALILGGNWGAYFGASGGAAVVTNQGTIAGTLGVGINLGAGGTLTNSGTGALIYGANFGIYAFGQPVSIVNDSAISAHSGVGVYLGGGGTVTNSASAQIEGATYGVQASNTAIGVANQGSIVGTTDAGINLVAGGTVTNSGTAALISGGQSGIMAPGGAATVSNQGSIIGTGNYGLILGQGGVVTNSAGAVISGGLDGIYSQGGGALTVTNQGSITGGSGGFFGINLQDGGLVLNTGTGASIAGNDGGVFADNVAATVSNQGSIVGTATEGVYLGAGGTVANSGTAALISGAQYGIKLHGGAATVIAQGTISGATAAVQFANVSGNVFELYPGAVLSGIVKGGTGHDTLELPSSSSAATISGIGSQYTGFEAFDLDANAQWLLSGSNTVAQYATISLGASATLTVSDSLVSLGKLTLAGSGTIATSGTGAIEVGTAGNATAGQFLIDAGRTMVTTGSVSLHNVLNRGVVSGTSNYGLYLGAGGTVTNGIAAARISGLDDGIAAKGAATIHNLGTIAGTAADGVYLGAGGSVTNSGTAAVISGNYGIKAKGSSAAAVANFGSIISTSFVGVYLGAGGSVTNASTASVIYGRFYGVDIRNHPASITNLGTIAGPALSVGVYLAAGGSVTNSGTAAVIYGLDGVDAIGSPAAVTNQGTITASTLGVYLQAGGTVTNSGTISGSLNAILFGGGYDNRLVVDPGAVFSGGDVEGGNTVDATAISTLELASGAGAGTLAGLGSRYVNFAQTTIDAGASWTLTGSNTLAAGATLTNAGTLELANATLTDSGVLENDGGITLDPSTLTVGTLLGTGSVTIDLGGTLEAQGTVASGETIVFGGSNATLHLDTPGNFSGNVSNLGLGDLIDLKGITPASVNFAAGTLSFPGGSFAVSLNGAPDVQAIASADGTVFEVIGPVMSGTAANQPVTDLTTIDPFSTVTITDDNIGQTEIVTVTLSNAANGTLSNLGTGNFSNGVYTDTGTAAQVTADLDNLVFAPSLDPAPLGHTITTTFTIKATDTAGAFTTDSTASVVASSVTTLVTLATFDGSGNGATPLGGLIADAAGNLLGTTSLGGSAGDGTVFEIAKSGGGYASTPTTLVTFHGVADGAFPRAGLLADAAGDLFGTTTSGGSDGAGAVFEIVNFGPGNYAGTPTTLAPFSNGNDIGVGPIADLIADAAGDLFGTVPLPSGANLGAVFEIANTATGYATTPSQVAGFSGGADGGEPKGVLTADAAGDLFGTTSTSGAGGNGTVFEIANTATGYATTPLTLVTFDGSGNGGNPLGGLITDTTGDLFGTTSTGGAHDDGTVFEIVNTATGYATTPLTLVTFDGTGNGANPADTLIADANGDLFGTTQNGGANGDGTVFEIANTATGYATSPTTLATFDGSGNGANPYAGLLADVTGNLFGTTKAGGANGLGTAFEVVSTDATFVPLITGTAANQAATDATTIDPFAAVTIIDGNSGQTETVTVTLSDAANGTLSNLSGGAFNNGVYTDTGTAAQVTAALDNLVFTPTAHQVPQGQTVTTTFTIQDSDTAGASATNSTTSVHALSLACFAEGTRIRTERGAIAVEALQIGDRVPVGLGNKPQPIIWLGHRRIDCRRHPEPQQIWPIRLRAGAFGPGRPFRDMLLSPDHAVYLNDVLIPIRYLVNGRTIRQEPRNEITYWHVELAEHNVLYAEGIPAESYLDTGNRGAFANGGAVMDLHADFARSVWETSSCAPLVLSGPQLAAAKLRLHDRVNALGHRTTGDANLKLLVDGNEVFARRAESKLRVRLPEGTGHVRLTSRIWIPSHMRPDAEDARPLGIAVSRVWLDGEAIGLDEACFTHGWHAPEQDWRWTNGDAWLAPWGARELAFEVMMTGLYWRDEADVGAGHASRRRAVALQA